MWASVQVAVDQLSFINKNSSRSQIPVSYINALMQMMENMINDMLKAFTWNNSKGTHLYVNISEMHFKCELASKAYLDYSTDDGLYRRLNVAFTGDHKEGVLEIAAHAWMCVCATHDHIVLSVQVSIFRL